MLARRVFSLGHRRSNALLPHPTCATRFELGRKGIQRSGVGMNMGAWTCIGNEDNYGYRASSRSFAATERLLIRVVLTEATL